MYPVLTALRRHPWLAGVILAVCLGAGAGALALASPTYRSTVRVGLMPADGHTDLGQVSLATPFFTSALTSQQMRQRALQHSDELGNVNVRTFRDSPLIFEVQGTATTAHRAATTARAYTAALQQATKADAIMPRGSVTVRVLHEADVPQSPVSPRPMLTLGLAGVAGVALGSFAAVLSERRTRGAPKEPKARRR